MVCVGTNYPLEFLATIGARLQTFEGDRKGKQKRTGSDSEAQSDYGTTGSAVGR